MTALQDIESTLERSWKNAQAQWGETASTWRDSKGAEFANTCWSPLESEIPALLGSVHQILEAVRESRRRISG